MTVTNLPRKNMAAETPASATKRIRAAFSDGCREFGEPALAVLAEIMNDPRVSASSRQRSAQMILAYGYGQPTNRLVVDVEKNDGKESDEQRQFRETVEKATMRAAEAMRVVPQAPAQTPALQSPGAQDNLRADTTIEAQPEPPAEVYAPNEPTPAESATAEAPEHSENGEPQPAPMSEREQIAAQVLGIGAAIGLAERLKTF